MIEKIAKKYNLTFPKNDIIAYKKYPKYNFIYNKLELFKFQNIDCNPLPIQPNIYPIVVKPIINLMGMGMDAKKINNIEEFIYLKSINGFFWCKFLNGKHHSWDLLINKGKIIYYVVFEGVKFREKDKFGLFKYWKNVDVKMYKIIEKLVKEKFYNFTGHINLETIGKNIIEAHLRFGDIDFCHEDIILLALLNINNKYIDKQLTKVKNNNYDKLYLYPVWMKIDDKINKFNIIYKFIEDNIEDEIINNEKFRGYYFDEIDHPNPSNYKRWLLLIGYDNNFLQKKSIEYKKKIDFFCKKNL